MRRRTVDDGIVRHLTSKLSLDDGIVDIKRDTAADDNPSSLSWRVELR